jgi:hypothetical protein
VRKVGLKELHLESKVKKNLFLKRHNSLPQVCCSTNPACWQRSGPECRPFCPLQQVWQAQSCTGKLRKKIRKKWGGGIKKIKITSEF